MENLINKIQNKYPYEYLGNQLLINGDCLKVMELIDDKSVDAIICDPPYLTTKRGCSGTTGVACKKLNRNFIGIELDETYYKLGVNRVKEELKQGDNV